MGDRGCPLWEEQASTAPMATSRGGLGPRFTVMTSRPGVESSAFLLLEHAALPMAPVFPCSMMNVILPVGLLRVQIPHAHHHHALPLQLAPVALALNALSSPPQVVKMVVVFSTVSDLPALTMCVPPRACCSTTGDCVILVPDTCSAVGGTSDAADCASSSCAPPACPEDLNDNGSVDFADLLEVLGSWGACGGCDEDFDGNGVVGFDDLLNLLSKWGPVDQPINQLATKNSSISDHRTLN